METSVQHGYVEKLPSGWSKARHVTFTADDVLDAYQAGQDDLIQQFLNAFKEAFNNALEESERLFLEIRRVYKLSPERIYVRWTAPSTFEALYPIPEVEYVSEAMLKVMQLARKREKEIMGDIFDLQFHFMPQTASTSEAAITGDGFIFYYEREPKQ